MGTEQKHTPEPWVACTPNTMHRFIGIVGNRDVAGMAYDVGSVRWHNEFSTGGSACIAPTQERAEANAARIAACVNACAGMVDPAKEIETLRTHSCLRTICEALGWQGGTIHQAVAEISRLRAEDHPGPQAKELRLAELSLQREELLGVLRALLARHDKPHGFEDAGWYADVVENARAVIAGYN